MSRYSGGDAICQALLDCGVTHLFGLPGTQNVPLFESLRTSQLKVIVPTHELSAGFMANGYYRATGRLPVVLTIPGPGFTYVTTALAEAKHDSAAIVYLTVTPESVPGKNFCLQELPQSGMVRPLVKEVLKIQSASEIYPKIQEAVNLAMSGEPGPVYVEIESSVIRAEARAVGAYRTTASPISGDLEATAAFLKAGSRVVVFTGAGAFGAVGEIEQLLSITGARLVTTCSGRGVIPEDDPRNMTIDLSTGGVDQLNQLLERADRIIVVGAKLGHNGSGGFRVVIPKEKLVRIDASNEVVGSNYPTDYPLVGDARDVLRELCSRLIGFTSEWGTEPKEGGDEMPDIVPATRDATGLEVGIEIFISQIRAALPRSAICLTDSGWHQMLLRRFYKVLAPRGLIVPADFQSMGYGIPAAIGAAVADPGRRVLCVVGDGGLLMSGMDLATAVRLHLNMTFIVFRDGHYGLIRLQQARGYGESFGTELPNIDYHALCDSLGVSYHYGPSINENELKSIVDSRGVSLVECPIFDRPSFEKLVRKTRFKRSLRRVAALSGLGKIRKLFSKGPG